MGWRGELAMTRRGGAAQRRGTRLPRNATPRADARAPHGLPRGPRFALRAATCQVKQEERMSSNAAVIDGEGAGRTKKWMLWTGRGLSALPILMLLMSASMKLTHQAQMAEMFVRKFGFVESALTGIGLLELTCVVLYAIPRTAVLGAVLVTGYLGGAIVTHVRVQEAFAIPLVLGILVWAGLYLRDERVRALMPLRAAAFR